MFNGLLLALWVFLPTLLYGNQTSFMEENDLHLRAPAVAGVVTEQDFNATVKSLQGLFGPISKQTGKDLHIIGKWNDNVVNAYAYEQGGARYVEIFGGLARRPEVTVDGLMLVLCHEIGHHLGGFPKYSGQWASNEGQSDYYATHACAKLVWADDFEGNERAAATTPENIRSICNVVWYDIDSRNICYRSLLGGKSLAELLASLNGEYVSLFRKDKSVVRRTQDSHPRAQCRLDTYVSGSLCEAMWDHSSIPLTEQHSNWVSCPMDEFEYGWRPRCWFAPRL
jgi:hypothetical protein